MNGMLKIGAGVVARIMDFAFSGYGLVCDVVFLKLIVQHVGYRYISCLQWWRESSLMDLVNASWVHLKAHVSDLMQSGDESRTSYYRQR
jgi:hypothetical protein